MTIVKEDRADSIVSGSDSDDGTNIVRVVAATEVAHKVSEVVSSSRDDPPKYEGSYGAVAPKGNSNASDLATTAIMGSVQVAAKEQKPEQKDM